MSGKGKSFKSSSPVEVEDWPVVDDPTPSEPIEPKPSVVVVRSELTFDDYVRGDLREVELDAKVEKLIERGWLIDVAAQGV